MRGGGGKLFTKEGGTPHGGGFLASWLLRPLVGWPLLRSKAKTIHQPKKQKKKKKNVSMMEKHKKVQETEKISKTETYLILTSGGHPMRRWRHHVLFTGKKR